MIEVVNSTAEIWFRYLASAGVQATLLAAILLGIVWSGRRWSPALRHALLMVALLKFVIPPTLSLPTGLFSHFKPDAESASTTPVRYVVPLVREALWPAWDEEPRGLRVQATGSGTGAESRPVSLPASPVSPSRNQPLTLKAWLMLFHLLGALLIMSKVILQRTRLQRLAADAVPAKDTHLLDIHEELCRCVKPARKPALLLSWRNLAPMAFGTWKPVVVLPRDLVDTLPQSEIRVILGHELAHHRRWDLWLNWLQIPISSLWWFNPLYWLLARKIRGVREDCCDDWVVASGLASKEDYCRTLLQAARVASGSAMAGASLAYISESQPLRRRFQRIMSADFIQMPKLARRGILAVAVLALLFLPGIEPRAYDRTPADAGAPAISPAERPVMEVALTAPGVPGPGSAETGVEPAPGGVRVL